MKKYIISIFLGLSLVTNVFAQTEVRRAPLAVSNDDGTNLSYPWKVTFTSGVTDNGNGTASVSVVNVHAHGEYTAAHATATAAASGFMPALSGLAADYLNGTGAWSIPSGTSLDHQHPNYTPLSDYSTHAHSQYSTTGQLGEVANQLGTHQHNVSYPSASQFQQLYSIATTNAHSNYTPLSDFTTHQHNASYPGTAQFQQLYSIATTNQHAESYPTIASLSAVANTLGLHQHNVSYPSAAQFQLLSQIATTNQHDTYYADIDHQHSGYQAAGSFADSSHMHSNYTARIDNIHPEYTPLSLYSVHAHPNYQVAGSFANATHNHSNYTPFSDFTTHQHNASYPGTAQFQQLYSIATTNQHDTYYSDIDHQHPDYSTSTQLGDVADLLGTHQHNVSYPSASNFQQLYSIATTNTHPNYTPISDFTTHQHNASYPGTAQFQQLYSIATTNQHDIYYADIDHQHSAYQTAGSFADASHIHPNYTARIDNTHPEYTPLSLYSVHTHSNYQVAGSFADATHNHSNYTPLSDFTTHQHNANYATVAQNQAVAAIATTNTHAVATPASFGFVLALPNDATKYWDGSGAYSVPAGSGTTGHLHPFYTPLSDYGTHAHTNYVPYTGATSTVNLGSQHLIAGPAEIDGTLYVVGNVGIGTADTSISLPDSGRNVVVGGVAVPQYILKSSSSTQQNRMASGGDGLYFDNAGSATASNNIFVWRTSNINSDYTLTERMRLTSNGRVGINNTNPTELLDVTGNVKATNLYGKYDNTHATVNTTHVGFTPILPNVATQFLSGTGAWSVPTSDASPHTHTTYVPYTGANSTVNLGAQHLVADTVEFDGTAYITGNTGIGKTPQTLLDVDNRFLVNSTSKTLTDAATQLFEVALSAGAMTGGIIIWTIEAGDATDWQSLSGVTTYAAVNKAGSYYTTVNNNTANDSKATSSGTLTTVWDILTGANKVIIRVTPTGSLTETIYRITYTISNNNSQAITIL